MRVETFDKSTWWKDGLKLATYDTNLGQGEGGGYHVIKYENFAGADEGKKTAWDRVTRSESQKAEKVHGARCPTRSRPER